SGTTGHFSSFARNHCANSFTPSEAKKPSSKSLTCPLTSLRTPAVFRSAGFSRPISPNRQSFISDSSRSLLACESPQFLTPHSTKPPTETVSAYPVGKRKRGSYRRDGHSCAKFF